VFIGHGVAIKFYKWLIRTAHGTVENKGVEGSGCSGLAMVYLNRGNCKKAIEYHYRHLAVIKATRDNSTEDVLYGGLGSAFLHVR